MFETREGGSCKVHTLKMPQFSLDVVKLGFFGYAGIGEPFENVMLFRDMQNIYPY